MNTFGDNLKRFREVNGFSQQELAEKLGTTQQRISEWERNKEEPGLYNLLRLSKALGVGLDELTEDLEI